MNLVLPIGDASRVVIGDAIAKTIRDKRFLAETSFYSLENDVPYVADVIDLSIRFPSIDLKSVSYFFLNEMCDSLDNVSPILLQETGDKMLMSLFMLRRFPAPFDFFKSVRFGGKFYKKASDSHPSEHIRPILSSLSENFPLWATILPNAREKMSLIIH